MAVEQFSLFGPPEPVAVAAPRKVDGVQWASYHPVKRVQCQHCVQVTHERKGAGPVDIRTARRRRTTSDGELLLCLDHADILHAEDEAAGLVGKNKTTATKRKQRPAS
ncbi:hypothetical protein [Micromonospora taraxaci]|uniref:hypothetical protein n=1 Tax=Micromonospora taraxaci TaxID=1316803 RepID=UPI0033B61927